VPGTQRFVEEAAMRKKDPLRGSAGFTVMEILVVVLLASVIVTAVYKVLIGQSRLYQKQTELGLWC
jgi:prepilin-type N-terminal cleavage/methylation domain-containing protein